MTPDMIVIGLAVAWSLSLPFAPDALFTLVDNAVGVLVLLLVVLLALPQGPVPGVLVLIAIALTFVERNRRKVSKKLLTDGQPSLKQQLAPAPPMSELEVHPEWENADESGSDDSTFYPKEDSSESFEPVAASINEKTAIPTIDSNTGSDSAERFFIRNHLAKTELD
jgi:hypothetical protein